MAEPSMEDPQRDFEPSRELLAATSRGDPEALAELYEDFGGAVLGVALRLLGSRPEAEDVLQDIFVRLPNIIATFSGRGSFAGWIRKVAARTALMRMRHTNTSATKSLGFGQDVPARSDRVFDRVDLERALAKLSPGLRAVFIMKEVEGYPHDEIADLLGITRSASEVRLFRARKVLRDQLERR